MIRRYLQALAAVRRSYPEEKRREEYASDLPAALAYRPLSVWVAPVFMAAGWPADAVTGLAIVLSLALPAIAAWGGSHACALVVAAALAVQVFDCADGSVARATGRSSRVGAMLDSIGSQLHWTAYFVTVGILAEKGGAGENAFGLHGREIGLALAVLFLAQRAVEDAFDACLRERVTWTPPAAGGALGRGVAVYGRLIEQVLAYGGLGLAGGLGCLPWFLAGLTVYQLSLLVLWLVRFIGRLLARR